MCTVPKEKSSAVGAKNEEIERQGVGRNRIIIEITLQSETDDSDDDADQL